MKNIKEWVIGNYTPNENIGVHPDTTIKDKPNVTMRRSNTMIVKIGDEKIIAEQDVTIIFKDKSIVLIEGIQTKFLYINPDEVSSVSIREKIKI